MGNFKNSFVFILFFTYFGCGGGGSSPGSLLALLGLSGGNPGYLVAGIRTDLDGNGSLDGVPLDVNHDGKLDGIDTDGNLVPDLLLVDSDMDGVSDSIDTNGDGTANFLFCTDSGKLKLTDSGSCPGNEIHLIDNNSDGYPDGFDTNNDGIADNTALQTIQSDSTIPTANRSAGNPSGFYQHSQFITLTCSDSVGPGGILYTLNGSEPNFNMNNGVYANAPSAYVSVYTSNTPVTLKYLCRDLNGNISSTKTETYTFDTHGTTIYYLNSEAYISASSGAIGSSVLNWSASRSGKYTIREGGNSCNDGVEILNGSNTANQSITNSINASSLSGEGQKTIRIFSFIDNDGNGICDPSVDYIGSQSFGITRDDTAPTVTVTPTPGNYTVDKSVALNCSDVLSGCDQTVYKLGYGSSPTDPTIVGSTGVITAGTRYTSPHPLADNEVHYFRYIARDLAGNVSAVTESIFALDKVAPTVQIYFLPNYVNATSNLSLEWRSLRSGTYEIRVGGNTCTEGVVAESGSMTAYTMMFPTIANSYFDAAGKIVRICVKSAFRTAQGGDIVYKDTVNPTISISPASGTYPSGQRITISCADSFSGPGTIVTTSDGTDPSFGSYGVPMNGTVSQFGIFYLGVGTVNLKAICADNAGNPSTIEAASFTSN